MNITFLLGNGFDIGMGLNTKYTDYYKDYCNISSQDNDNIIEFKLMLDKFNDENSSEKIIDWSDFEKAFGKHSEDFLISEKQLYIEQFEDFVEKFNDYLEKEEVKADFSNEEEIGQVMEAAIKQYIEIRSDDRNNILKFYNKFSGEKVYNFVSFNYTKTADECVKILKKRLDKINGRKVGKMLHIHGYVEENMIMGVNDPSQITNLDFSNDPEIISEIVKPQLNIDARTGYDSSVTSIINNSHVICVYGMSLGDTDKKWWEQIAKWLEKSEDHILVILSYEEKYNKKFVHNQNKYTNKIRNAFLRHSDLDNDIKDRISQRIYIGINNNVFEVKCVKSYEDRLKEAYMSQVHN